MAGGGLTPRRHVGPGSRPMWLNRPAAACKSANPVQARLSSDRSDRRRFARPDQLAVAQHHVDLSPRAAQASLKRIARASRIFDLEDAVAIGRHVAVALAELPGRISRWRSRSRRQGGRGRRARRRSSGRRRGPARCARSAIRRAMDQVVGEAERPFGAGPAIEIVGLDSLESVGGAWSIHSPITVRIALRSPRSRMSSRISPAQLSSSTYLPAGVAQQQLVVMLLPPGGFVRLGLEGVDVADRVDAGGGFLLAVAADDGDASRAGGRSRRAGCRSRNWPAAASPGWRPRRPARRPRAQDERKARHPWQSRRSASEPHPIPSRTGLACDVSDDSSSAATIRCFDRPPHVVGHLQRQ